MKNFFMLHLVLFLAIFAENVFGLQPGSNQGGKHFQTIILTEQALEDLDFFFSTMESIHPQLLANVSADDYLDMKHEIRKWVEGNSGSISLSEFIRALTKSAAFFKDGHNKNTRYCHNHTEQQREA